jgi:hypothetical protein
MTVPSGSVVARGRATPVKSCGNGSDEQMFGAKQQDPHEGGSYKEAETAARRNFVRQ